MSEKLTWHRALSVDELPEGRVKTVTCALKSVCMTKFKGEYAALDNRCPHQGGPLGEGSIENGWLRCPWHGWDFHPTTGDSPGGHDDGVKPFPIEVRDDGIYVGIVADPAVRTVSTVVAETLTNWGLTWVFGMVGHSNLGLADALRVQAESGDLRFIGIRHEGAASFACSAYGKLTGKPAAALAIAGPGATNLLTGLWDANVDRSPVLALTGQVQTQVLGRGAFQEIDQTAAFGKVAQFSATMLHQSNHGELAALAMKSALLNSGVSHLIFPDEVQVLKSDDKPAEMSGRITLPKAMPDPDQLAAATALLTTAKRACIIVGHGARFHMDEVIALAKTLGCPILTTFKAKGQISDAHELAGGVLGRSGTPIASWFMNEADLLVVLGASFSNHTGITAKKPIVQVDYDAMAIGKHHPITAGVFGDIGHVTTLFREAVNNGHEGIDQRGEVAERWDLWRAEKRRRAQETGDKGLHSVVVFETLAACVDDDAIIAVDVGNNTYSFGRYFEVRDQTVLMSGYLGSIGFALPAAMGAWAATQEAGPWSGRQVVSVSGDGGLGQYLMDFTTWVHYRMNCTHVVLNNGELGKISKEQRAGKFDVWQTGLTNPNFAAFAENCGGLGIRVERQSDLQAALKKALAHDGPALVEIMTDVDLI